MLRFALLSILCGVPGAVLAAGAAPSQRSIPAPRPPDAVDPAAYGIDPAAFDKETSAAYERALALDRGDFAAEDKAEIWRRAADDEMAKPFAALALDRAARWDRYSDEKRAAAARRAPEKGSAPREAAPPSGSAGRGGVEWVRLEGGEFMMGTDAPDLKFPKPVHKVRVNTFDVSRTLVTFAQYRACVAAGGCSPPHVSDGQCYVWSGKAWEKGKLPASFQGDDQPVVCVDWDQAKAFAEWAGGRLLTEAEWEYAARSRGKNKTFPWGEEPASCERAVMDEGAAPGCGRASTWPVCSKPKGNTEQGLCDMVGNVWVWLQDRFHLSYEGAPADGSAWETPTPKVMLDVTKRGGGWRAEAGFMRTAFRGNCSPLHAHDYNGVRIARSVAR